MSTCKKRLWIGLLLLAVGILFFFVTVAHAQDEPATTSAVGDYVRAEMQRQHIPAWLFWWRARKDRAGGRFWALQRGIASAGEARNCFPVGSVGKQFTATAVMMLVEEGKVGLDDPLTKYFTDAPASWKDVTVRELLSHTAGFGDYPEKFDFRKDWTEDELLKNGRGHTLGIPAGHKVGV